MRFKVENLSGNIYQVLERVYVGEHWTSYTPPVTTSKEIVVENWNVLFQGTLPECEAWIRLKEGGYL
jgi:hypothetical protein